MVSFRIEPNDRLGTGGLATTALDHIELRNRRS